MKKNVKKVLSGLSSVSMLACAQATVAEANVTIESTEEVVYNEVANVKGGFTFNQKAITPGDEIFSMFGTAATGVCAKPAFAMDEVDAAEKYYINVSGRLEKSYTTTLADLKKKGGSERIIVCSCGTGASVAQAKIVGANVSDVLQLAGLQEDANAIAFKSADGYTATLPLKYVLDKEAMLAWQIGDEANPVGLQVWMPGTVASYFTRQVTEIEVMHTDEEISVKGVDPEQRAKISILNHMGEACSVGDELIFSGYADDCGTAIAAVEFSMDGGKTWSAYKTLNANPDKWVNWEFSYKPETAGYYKLDVRAVTADGTVSPLASSVIFEVA